MIVFAPPAPTDGTHLAEADKYAKPSTQLNTTIRRRYLFTVDGRALHREYVEKPMSQVEAICRKSGGYSIPLWRHLKSADRVRCQTQVLHTRTGTWRQV